MFLSNRHAVALLAVTAFVPWIPASAGAQGVAAPVVNHVPDFTAFYLTATDSLERVSSAPKAGDMEKVRWELWKELYAARSFPEADLHHESARSRFEGAWDRYPEVMDRIRSYDGGLEPAPEDLLREVADVLGVKGGLEVPVVLYVGTFDRAPSLSVDEGRRQVRLPVEQLPGPPRPLLIRLFAQATQAHLSGRAPEENATLAEVLLARGIGMRVHEVLAPGLSPERYLSRSLDWLLEVELRDRSILEGLREQLSRPADPLSGAAAGRGGGPGGDLDYAAWRLVGQLMLRDDWTLARMARLPAEEVPDLVAEAIDAVIAGR